MTAAEEEANKATLRRFEDAISTNDPEIIAKTIDELIDPDVVIHMPMPLQETGSQALKHVWPMLLRGLPDLHVAFEDVIAEGTRSSCATRSPGPTGASTGASHQPASPSPTTRSSSTGSRTGESRRCGGSSTSFRRCNSSA
jgi:SnoaL-like polyketide cyclase